jgi:hypothetical protein
MIPPHTHTGDAPSWCFLSVQDVQDSEYYTKGSRVFLAQLPKPTIRARICTGRIGTCRGIPTVETDSATGFPAFFTNVYDTYTEAEEAWAQWEELRIKN